MRSAMKVMGSLYCTITWCLVEVEILAIRFLDLTELQLPVNAEMQVNCTFELVLESWTHVVYLL